MAQAPPGTRIQSLVFDKRIYTASGARSWAAAHGFKASRTEEQANTFRIRQEPSGRFQDGTFRAIRVDDGVQAVIASPKDGVDAQERARRRKKTPKKKRKQKFSWKDPVGWLMDRLE